MKRSAILLLLLLGTGLAILVSTLGESSSYVDFETAATEPGRGYHVVGTLDRSVPLVYDAEKDANLFQFALVDQKGLSRTVVYYGAKPQDFERSEQVVIIGKMSGSAFEASKILTKCPSKYNEDSVEVRSTTRTSYKLMVRPGQNPISDRTI